VLDVVDLVAGYGEAAVLQGVSLTVPGARITCLMGRNGVGKSTLLRTIMGQVRASSGQIILDGLTITELPAHRVPRAGIALVPQGRRLFGPMTVAENLAMGLAVNKRGARTRDRALALFPRLADRLGQVASTLSGGEQQMLAIARALCASPKLLLLDEPSEGLQPSMVRLIRDTVAALRADGVSILLVEHRVETALALADQIAFMDRGAVQAVHPVAALRADRQPFATWLGV
jgi:branched-chain amino acid transport system ATP-binding protein